MLVPPRFKFNLAIELGELVAQAYAQYEAFKEGKPWTLEGRYRFVEAIGCASKAGALDWLRPEAKGDTEPIGFVARRGTRAYVIFRGTKTAREWTKNLSFNLKEFYIHGHGEVHAGFLDVYSSLRESLLATLASVRGASKIFIAGHSLGGALATLAAPDIRANAGARVKAIYTFASPRVGDDAFVQAFNREFAGASFRTANGSDIVTAVPLPVPIGMGGYFSHVDAPADFTAQRGNVEENHAMDTYLAALKEAQRGKGIRGVFHR